MKASRILLRLTKVYWRSSVACHAWTSIAKCARKHSFCLVKQGRKLQLRRNHPYFYQVQVQMFAARKSCCDFCMYSPTELHTERIVFEPQFFASVLPKLQTFYLKFVLPQLSSSLQWSSFDTCLTGNLNLRFPKQEWYCTCCNVSCLNVDISCYTYWGIEGIFVMGKL